MTNDELSWVISKLAELELKINRLESRLWELEHEDEGDDAWLYIGDLGDEDEEDSN